ncbi:3-hydroxyacyl-CoA dehydrogenase family protein [Thalassomonas actiniarum]|uniref:3-hydroxybutyryl-CoA dehydrogenase n=1 Tax=Thalassomonas actiniarum TaxID=485447 RepID=A0AAE9YY18_9GAMM|nr:3-hydroxyacyl-CoA dehydrogenase NAD-binding domain-containing protein [Thalassomonas actiniarum]WDE02525.1 3-hydroxybutyryl-CoA dehydrogenase [Thalassomonas actiniarum]
MTQQVVGVIGAGVMGTGVAQNLAQSGFNVVLLDISTAVLDKAANDIRNNIRFQAFSQKDKSRLDDPDEVLQRIVFTTDYQALAQAFYVIENVSEQWHAKSSVYPQLEAVCPAHTVYAADTSCYSITRIAALTKRPDKVIGIHFMNPVPMKPTVETIRGWHTSKETIAITDNLLSTMGKTSILVEDSPGFVSNRILMLTVNEAVFTVQDQVADAQQVDEIFKKCFGHKMGPLETADLIGLDTILYSIEVLHESFADSKYRPCPLLKKMVDAGLLGRKSGEGFYKY